MSDFEVEFDFADQEIEAVFELNVVQSYKFRDGITETGGIVTLDKATKESIGGIIVGENLDVTETGILSADVGHGILTVKVDDEEVGTFSANAKENVEINIDLPEVTWGNIQGNIEDQIDLMETLDNLEDAVNNRIDEVEDIFIEEINKKQDILTEENAGDGISITNEDGTIKINNTRVSAEWGNIEGDITEQTDLIDYIDENGGKIDVIKRNDVVLPIEDKTVNIEVPEDATEIAYSNPDYPTVAEALDKLLYVAPTVSISGGGNYEIGYTKETTNLTWTWNKTIKTQSLNQGIGSLDPAIRSYTYNTPITSNTTFTITGSDGTNTRSASTSVNFLPKRYWGVSTKTELTDADILALSSELSTSRAQTRTFNCSGGKYFYFVIRTQYCSGIKFKVGGLSFSDMLLTTRNVVNAQGYEAQYNIYRVNNIQTGSAIVVEVS